MHPLPAAPVGTGGKQRSGGSWLILDRFIHRSDRDVEDDEGVGTASAISYTCTDRPIRASLRVADSPEVSRLYLHWPGRPEFRGLPEPRVIAAHEHSILFEAIVPLEDPMSCKDTFRFPIDLFVYSAFSPPPSLHRLPVCFTGGVSTPDEDIYFKPYRRRQQRTMLEEEVGLLCNSEGEFTVVDSTNFGPEGELCLLHHPGPNSIPQKSTRIDWMIKNVRFPQGPSAHHWITDAIIPFRERFLCWVDYYQGILVVDVLIANDKSIPDHELHFIPMPKEVSQSVRPDPDGDCADPARCVCVNRNGMLKLVCIFSGKASRAFTIKSWTLPHINHGGWHKGETMQSAEFWGLCNGSLPPVKPMYPVVSLVDTDDVYFLLEEQSDGIKDHATYWIVEVSMRNKVMKSKAIYINEEEEGCITDRACRNVFDGHSFIPSRISFYLGKGATASRELSEMMQKAKLCKVAERKAAKSCA